jgi:hypothetical protein
MRQNWLSNRIFKSFDDIVDHCRFAWNTLIDQPWKIMPIALRDWAAAGHGVHNSIGTSWQRASTIISWIVSLEIEHGARHSQMVQSD